MARKDACLGMPAHFRTLVMKLWEDVVQGAQGDARSALSLFSADAVDGGERYTWAFVPAADILLTVGEGIVGITYEGAYVLDPRKRRAGGIWASLSLTPGTAIDSEVRRLVDDFDINDPTVVGSLIAHASSRPSTKSRDIEEIRSELRGASNPTGALATALQRVKQKSAGGFQRGGVTYARDAFGGKASQGPMNASGKGPVNVSGKGKGDGSITVRGVTYAAGSFGQGAQHGAQQGAQPRSRQPRF